MRFAVGDVHGHRIEVRAALLERGLIDAEGDWAGGTAEVWFLGDLLDRGPDGVGVIEDVMRWQGQAQLAGGCVGSVLGNHEVLALGFRRFRNAVLLGGQSSGQPRTFGLSWLVNGGQVRDQELLTAEMVDWMSDLPAVVRSGDDLLIHADTTGYLHWGADLDAINQEITKVLHDDDIEAAWHLWAEMTGRYAFRGADGPTRARSLLDSFGAARVVHGHSIIADLLGVEPSAVTGPLVYADGLALAVDGGIYAGGPSLVVPLDEHHVAARPGRRT
jgi:Calcineurin-like phosphoesterase